MRRRVFLVSLVAGLTALVAWTQGGSAQAVERVRIADPARQAHGLPAGLAVELSSPAAYNRLSLSGSSGRWTGPRYEELGNPGNAGFASIDWSVSFDERPGEADAAALAHITHRNWERDQRGGLSVPHVVGKRAVGTLLGYYYLVTPTTTGGEARFEAALAFPLDTNLYAIAHLEALEPPNDTYTLGGSVLSSTWNRGQVLVALAGVRLQGNLPPKIVGARTAERGRLVTGKVVDRFLDAVIGTPVSLERLTGGSWRRIARGKTSQSGFYSLSAGKRGRYRVTARMAAFTAQSREIRAGR
ncbi:MAG: hypothetical protein M3R26_03315 [Actinomycetota bacterium]|nr:hypothetical protein [Actinomycetota bacterium]